MTMLFCIAESEIKVIHIHTHYIHTSAGKTIARIERFKFWGPIVTTDSNSTTELHVDSTISNTRVVRQVMRQLIRNRPGTTQKQQLPRTCGRWTEYKPNVWVR